MKAVKVMWLTENATTISQETVPDDEEDEKNEVIDMQVDTENTDLSLFFSRFFFEKLHRGL